MNTISFSKIFTIITFLILISPVTVSAYYLTFDAPSEVRVGEPITISGTTNIPPPDKIDIVFSHSINIPVEITRQSRDITEKGENSFNATFETTGLEKGNYKIEAMSQTLRDFSAGSKNLRVIKLTDRSDIIRFSSPKYQDFENKLTIEARIQDYEDNAIQMEVRKGNTSVFGPESVPVNRGLVKYELPIDEPGQYTIIFTDYKGYIGAYPVQVGEETVASPTSHPTEKVTENTTPIPPAEQTPVVTSKPSEEPTKNSVQTQPSETTQPVQQETMNDTSISGISASASVSRDSPGYFLVSVKNAPVRVTTSENDDWVVEYKTSTSGAGVKINDLMKPAAEKFSVSENTKQIYLKVYPYSYKTGSEVTITADNADDIHLSDEAAKAFGAPPRYGEQPTSTQTKSPAPLAALIFGLVGAFFIIQKRP